jgi:hypothetical protein
VAGLGEYSKQGLFAGVQADDEYARNIDLLIVVPHPSVKETLILSVGGLVLFGAFKTQR